MPVVSLCAIYHRLFPPQVKRHLGGMVSSASPRVFVLLVCILLRLGSDGVSADCEATVKHSVLVNCDNPTKCSSNWTTLRITGETYNKLTPRFFQPCSNLKELQFSSSPMKELNGERLRGLSALVTMSLSEVPVHSLSPAVFSRVPSLKHFTISRGNIRELRAESFKPCAEITEIAILENPLLHLRPFVFSECEITLTKLRLRSGKINWFLASAFSRLTSLKTLDLTHNRLTALGPRLFSDLSDLRSLILKENYIRSIDVNAFQGLTALTKLDLSNNRITEFKAISLLHLPYLKRILLANNRILKVDPASQWPDRSLMVSLRANRLECRPESKSQKIRFSGLPADLAYCSDKTPTTAKPTTKAVVKQPKSQRLAENRRDSVDLPRKADNQQFILVTPSWLLVWAIIMTVAFAIVVCVLVFMFLSKRRADQRRRDERTVQEVPLNEQATL